MNIPEHSITRRRAIAALAAAAGFPGLAAAQPDRPVRMIVASSPGATIDGVVRTVQPTFASSLGSPLVVENIPGAGGVIAMQALARAQPDGSVLCFQTNNMVTAPLLLKQAPYDAVRDFTPISIVGVIPLAVVVNPARMPASTPQEFIALLKRNSKTLNYGSSGPGTTLHLAIETIRDGLGLQLTHVPYKGVAPMVADLLGGQIDFVATSLPAVQAHIDSGALRNVGMLTHQRVAAFPSVPTFAEKGFPNFTMEVWMAVLGPKGMAPATVAKIHRAVLATFNDPAMRDTLEKQGNIIKVSTPDEALAEIRQDATKYAALAKKINLTP